MQVNINVWQLSDTNFAQLIAYELYHKVMHENIKETKRQKMFLHIKTALTLCHLQ